MTILGKKVVVNDLKISLNKKDITTEVGKIEFGDWPDWIVPEKALGCFQLAVGKYNQSHETIQDGLLNERIRLVFSESEKWFMPKYTVSGGSRGIQTNGNIIITNGIWSCEENNNFIAHLLRWLWHKSKRFRKLAK